MQKAMPNQPLMADRTSTSRRQWMVGRPKTACGQCKNQKLRCSGDKPICKRCSRLGHKCSYQIASAQRASRAPRVVTTVQHPPSPSSSINHEGNSPAIVCDDEGIANIPAQNASYSARPSGDQYLGIPATLVSNLIEVYYANVYNATLLLHRPSLRDAVAAGTARPHVVLSVCAWAANFYHDADGKPILRDQGFMMEWADRASRLVFQQADDPHEDNIVTFINLALLYYSQGIWHRSFIHKGNGTLLAQVFGLGSERTGKEDLMESESRRRLYWACYLINCHAAEPSGIITAEPSDSTLNLSLPWREEDFERGIPSRPQTCLVSDQSNGGLFCELIKAMTIWSTVNGLMKAPVGKMDGRISAIHALENRISQWWAKLPACLDLTPDSVPGVALDVLPKLLLIHTVYHQSLAVLHASIVPMFSLRCGDESWLPARQISAQVALEHAYAASDLFDAVLTHFPMLSAIPSFVAYAAYCGCAIQIPFMWCSETAARTRAHRNVRINAKIISTLSQYWKLTSLFEIYVHHLYQIHAQNPAQLDDEPRHINPSKLTELKFRAGSFSKTILSFNRILWTKSGGCVQPGDELTDLNLDEDDEPGSGTQSTRKLIEDRFLQIRASGYRIPSPGQFEDENWPALDAFNSNLNLTSYNWKDIQPDQQTTPQDLPNLDFFLPSDPDMVGLNGNILNFQQFDTGLFGLDFFGR